MKQTVFTVAASVLFSYGGYAQCTAPTGANVSTTNIVCAGSGMISVTSVSDNNGNVPLTNCQYSLYDAGNTVQIKPIQASAVLNGLDSGTYTLRIQKICLPSGISSDYTTTVHLSGYYQLPVLSTPTITSSTCADGAISISATKGSGSYSFCMVDSLNAPVAPTHYVRNLQASGTFSNLAAGTYYIRVYDGCSGFTTQPVIVPSIPATLGFTDKYLFQNGCTGYTMWQLFDRNITLDANNKAWLTYYDGSTDTLPDNSAQNIVEFNVPLSKLGSYPASFSLTYSDVCGHTFSRSYTINQPNYYLPAPTAGAYNCSYGIFYVRDAQLSDSANLITPGDPVWDTYSLDGGVTWRTYVPGDTVRVPVNGSRSIFYKLCGQIYTTQINGPAPTTLNLSAVERSAVACNGNSGIGFNISTWNGSLDSVLVHVTSQPAAQPAIADFYLNNTFTGSSPGAYPSQLLNLAPGTYSFLLTDQCGSTKTITRTITASTQTLTVTPQFTCGATQIALNIKYTTTKNGELWLWYVIRNSANQKIDSAYVDAGSARAPGGMTVILNNLQPDIYTVSVWKTDNLQSFSSQTACGAQVFTVDGRLPATLSVSRSAFALCTNDPATGTILVTPQGGIPPYTYSLYKDSVSAATLVSAPQSSNTFFNVQANAPYIIVATDQCGAGLPYKSVFGNVQPQLYASSALVPCYSDSVTLSVAKNSGLTYQWSKNGTAIAGATDTFYHITSVQAADSGVYNVQINANSCLLLSTSMLINPNDCGIPFPLPIELLNFNGTVNAQQNAVLNWKTAHEERNTVFSVWYSTDGSHFNKAGAVPGNATGGTYSFTHSDYKLSGKTYYKLLLTDATGADKYSPVIMLQSGQQNNRRMEASPVPFTTGINVAYTATGAGNITLQLTDVSGRILKTQSATVAAGVNSIPVSGLDALPNGTYFLKATDEAGQMQALKVQK